MDMHTGTPGTPNRREPRSGAMNLLVFLALVPFDVLVGGYAWLAVGMEGWAASHGGEPPVLPVAEVAISGGLLAAAGLAVCWGRYWGAAVIQFALTAVLMVWLLSAYG
ncbi:hypothetical protein ACIG0A_30545 [Streptomyces californicus]|uniref:hypothetical protein n=1 Tax=Streptomyces TaxID=1883 RepID=UPI000BF236A7|nr:MULTISPECIES: hypothetical protein [Streptomyces]MCF3169222.1 hypothetical protein [Streptomyces violaceoruber]MDW4899000.1 hypothetical protein [Streptomyces californicus]